MPAVRKPSKAVRGKKGAAAKPNKHHPPNEKKQIVVEEVEGPPSTPTSSSPSDGETSEEESVQGDADDDGAKMGVAAASDEESVAAASEDGEGDDSDDGDDDAEDEANKKDMGFTDENAAWLKPKKSANQLLSSDDDDEEEESEDDDDDEDLLEIERDAQLVDGELEAERDEAAEEMRRTIRENTAVYHLPTAAELEGNNADRVVPPSEVRSHVESILEVLAEFKARREIGRSRQEYVDLLAVFIAELYGYLPELVEYFLTMFSPVECLEFIDASDRPRPLVIRTNTLKTRRKDLAAALIKRGVSLDPLAAWSKVGLKIVESPVPIGATPEYLSGMYMLQSAASMCPVLALAPLPKERVLDMAAAPGGKTSYIAQLMRNTGTIIANDLKPDRQKATVANLHRLGVKNAITCAYDGRKMGRMFKNRFDRVLLDAPCSGLGVISRDPSVKVQRTIADVRQCAHLQKELLLAAIDALKPCRNDTTAGGGGVMVYSTCSVSVYENEEVVNYALGKRDVQIVETGLDFGTAGFTRYQQKRFHPSMALARRFYPHTVNMDGFFVCKIKKLSDRRLDQAEGEQEEAEGVVAESEKVEEAKETTVKNVRDDKKRKAKKGAKKMKRAASAAADDEGEVANEPKKAKVSVPPKKVQQNVQKTNAKVTKPRRAKKAGATGDA